MSQLLVIILLPAHLVLALLAQLELHIRAKECLSRIRTFELGLFVETGICWRGFFRRGRNNLWCLLLNLLFFLGFINYFLLNCLLDFFYLSIFGGKWPLRCERCRCFRFTIIILLLFFGREHFL